MRIAALVLLMIMCVGATSCSQQSTIDRWSPAKETRLAKSSLSDLRQGNLDALKAQLDPKLLTPDIDEKLDELRGLFPPGKPRSIKTVGANTQYLNGIKRVSLTFEYQFDSAWALGNVLFLQQGDHEVIEGIHVQRRTQSLEQANAFSLSDKGPGHWLLATAACVIPLFCLFTFVLCLRTPIRRRKWLWAIFTLLGLTTFSMNWTTGQYAFQLLSFQLFGASMMSPLYGPWTIGISFPLGAVIFLLRRRSMIRQADAATPPSLPVRP
jgi:hypothetical protein